jgi:hypothetical protein
VKDRNWHSGLDEFFKRVDIDGDGQVGPTEARRYIGANLGATGEAEISAALTQMTDNLDSSDAGNTISEAEVEAHLRKLMQVQTLASLSWCTSEWDFVQGLCLHDIVSPHAMSTHCHCPGMS